MDMFNNIKSYMKLLISSIVSAFIFLWINSISSSITINPILMTSMSLLTFAIVLVMILYTLITDLIYILRSAARSVSINFEKINFRVLNELTQKPVLIFIVLVSFRKLNVVRC